MPPKSKGYHPILIPTEQNRIVDFNAHYCGEPSQPHVCTKPVTSKMFFPSEGYFVYGCEEHAEKDRKTKDAEQ